jgi:hypothetical protein
MPAGGVTQHCGIVMQCWVVQIKADGPAATALKHMVVPEKALDRPIVTVTVVGTPTARSGRGIGVIVTPGV